MINEHIIVSFPIGDRRALVSIDSNCSRYMTGFYLLSKPTPCNVIVDGAFVQGESGRGIDSGTMQFGNRFFDGALFVEGIRETIISMGQLDQQGCSTELCGGKMKVFGPNGDFMFSAFLHNGRYFLDTKWGKTHQNQTIFWNGCYWALPNFSGWVQIFAGSYLLFLWLWVVFPI